MSDASFRMIELALVSMSKPYTSHGPPSVMTVLVEMSSLTSNKSTHCVLDYFDFNNIFKIKILNSNRR